jgi:hypothetical protein
VKKFQFYLAAVLSVSTAMNRQPLHSILSVVSDGFLFSRAVSVPAKPQAPRGSPPSVMVVCLVTQLQLRLPIHGLARRRQLSTPKNIRGQERGHENVRNVDEFANV